MPGCSPSLPPQILTGEDWNAVMYHGIALEAGSSNSTFLCALVGYTLLSSSSCSPGETVGVYGGFLGFLPWGLFNLVSRPW